MSPWGASGVPVNKAHVAALDRLALRVRVDYGPAIVRSDDVPARLPLAKPVSNPAAWPRAELLVGGQPVPNDDHFVLSMDTEWSVLQALATRPTSRDLS